MKKIFLFAMLIMLIIVSFVLATPFLQEKLTASNGAADDRFGTSVSISGNVCIVGAVEDDSYTGSAYVFRFDGSNWIEEQKLIASDRETGDRFGYSVSIDANVCVVGAYSDEINGISTGSAYIFRYDGSNWVEEQKLIASDSTEQDLFGMSVSINGDICVIGSPSNDDDGGSSGSIYVFGYNGSSWIEEQKLTASDAAAGDQLGESVSVKGSVCMAGAPLDDDNGTNTGSAYVFRHNGSTWVQEDKLLAPGPGDNWECFGCSVSIDDDVCIVGSKGDNSNAGAAYIFSFNDSNWVQRQKLTASDAAADDAFGKSVSISGDICIAGAYLDDDYGTSSGSVYVFRLTDANWIEVDKLTAFDGESRDYFGESVCVDSGNVIAGASETYKDNGNGKAYVYQLCPTADLNGDCFVNLADFAILSSQWQEDPGEPSADIAPYDGDNIVNMLDLKVLVEQWLMIDSTYVP